MKRGVYGTFHHVSEAHLGRYLAEFDFRYSNRAALGVDDTMRSDKILRGTVCAIELPEPLGDWAWANARKTGTGWLSSR